MTRRFEFAPCLRAKWLLLCAALLMTPAANAADENRADSLRIDHAFARATPPGARSGAVFLTILNGSSQADRLLRASTPVAGGVILHQMAVEDGIMKMRAVPSLTVNPGGRLELKPDGYHLMLLDLKQPLKQGEKFPITLSFERAGSILVSVPIEAMGATGHR